MMLKKLLYSLLDLGWVYVIPIAVVLNALSFPLEALGRAVVGLIFLVVVGQTLFLILYFVRWVLPQPSESTQLKESQ